MHPVPPACPAQTGTDLGGVSVERHTSKRKRTMKNSRMFESFLAALGFLLSPLSWWNDPVVNIPIAYAVGWLFSLLSHSLFLPCMILGYWLTNVLGLVLMHRGVSNLISTYRQERARKKELFRQVLISVGYTLLIVALVALRILRLPHLYFR